MNRGWCEGSASERYTKLVYRVCWQRETPLAESVILSTIRCKGCLSLHPSPGDATALQGLTQADLVAVATHACASSIVDVTLSQPACYAVYAADDSA